MIAANELRIGNWVNDSTNYRIVKAIHNSYIQFSDGLEFVVFPISLDKIQPIPLTPSILEKCGLKYNRLNREYDIGDDFYIDKQFNVYYKVWEGSDDRGGTEPRVFRTIQSLHQLQNLYWCLTCEELTVNL